MMRRIIVTLLLPAAAVLCTPAAYGQEVIMDADKVIIDCTAATGMPAGAVTNVPKYTATGATNSAWLLGSEVAALAENAKVYEKFEIAPKDLMNNGALGAGENLSGGWASAYNMCKALTHNGIGWRLPSQRELQMMCIFREALHDFLDEVSGSPFAASNYWSATEFNTSIAWSVLFSNGYAHNDNKTYTSTKARCVREIMP